MAKKYDSGYGKPKVSKPKVSKPKQITSKNVPGKGAAKKAAKAMESYHKRMGEI